VFRKQPGGLFSAKSGEPGTEMPRISVGEPSVCKAQPQHTPNPFRRTKNTRVVFTALVFLLYLGCRDSNTSVQKSSSLSADFWENSPVDCSIRSDEPFRRTKSLR